MGIGKLPVSHSLSRYSRVSGKGRKFFFVMTNPLLFGGKVCRVETVSTLSAGTSRNFSGVGWMSPGQLVSTVAKVDRLALVRIGYIQGPDAVSQFADPSYRPPEIFSHRWEKDGCRVMVLKWHL